MNQVPDSKTAAAADFVQRWRRIWAEHDGDRWPDLLTEDGRLHNPGGSLGRGDLPGYMQGVMAAIPGHEIVATRWGATEDGVLIEWTMRGTLANGPFEIRGADRFTLVDGRASEGVAYFDPSPLTAGLQAGARTGPDVEQLARDYDAAWSSRDVDAIVAFHSPDGTYQLNVAGAPALTGRQALAEAFRASLDNWETVSFELVGARYAGDFYTWESRATGVLARPLALGAVQIPVTGRPISFKGVDVIALDGDGLIAGKSSYFDLVAAANQAASA